MGRDIFTTDEFDAWFADLDEADQYAVSHLVELLDIKWLALGAPYSSQLKGTKEAFRELRSNQHNVPLRVIYAFSPERNAVLIIGGDKTGNARFYEEILPVAERIWAQYLRERTAVTPQPPSGKKP